MGGTVTVAVDFDGVIHTYDRGWADGSIYGAFKPGAMAALMQLMAATPTFVFTTRPAPQVARWIERQSGHNIEAFADRRVWPFRRTFWNTKNVLLVTNRKLPAVAYLDDRAVPFTDWEQALADLMGQQPVVGIDRPAEAPIRLRFKDVGRPRSAGDVLHTQPIACLADAPSVGDAPMLGGDLFRVVDRVIMYSGAGQLQADGPWTLRIREIMLCLELIADTDDDQVGT